MNANELRDLADDLEGEFYDAIQKAVAYLRACADALEAGPVAWRYRYSGAGCWMLCASDPAEARDPAVETCDALYPVALPAPPEPPHECQTEAEKRAFAFGWWKAMETRKPEEVKMPEPMTDDEITACVTRPGFLDGCRQLEVEVLRRVKEANE